VAVAITRHRAFSPEPSQPHLDPMVRSPILHNLIIKAIPAARRRYLACMARCRRCELKLLRASGGDGTTALMKMVAAVVETPWPLTTHRQPGTLRPRHPHIHNTSPLIKLVLCGQTSRQLGRLVWHTQPTKYRGTEARSL